MQPLPAAELARLADEFATIAAGLDEAAGGPRRTSATRPASPRSRPPRPPRRSCGSSARSSPSGWRATTRISGRGRAARFPAPHLAILTSSGTARVDSLAGLVAALGETHESATIAELVEELGEQGYVEWRSGALQPTRAGYNVREAIESDTNELYFRQWPPLDADTLNWLHDTLGRLIAALPDENALPE
jgi:hypothetical protein